MTLKQILANKTDQQLMYYIEHVDKHTEEAVWMALKELQIRAVELPEDITEKLQKDIAATKKIKIRENTSPWKRTVVEDLDAPEYYSKTAIYTFSVLFSVLFGAFLLAGNCKDAGKPGWPAILFGFLYTILTVATLNHFNSNTSFTFLANTLGVIIMYELFWSKYIGNETKYRPKSVLKPSIIAACIFIPYFALLIYLLQTQN